MSYFLVTELPGPKWDHALPRREQARWAEHAAFIDTLAEQGGVVLGGPLGDPDFGPALLVVDAENEDDVPCRAGRDRVRAAHRRRLAGSAEGLRLLRGSLLAAALGLQAAGRWQQLHQTLLAEPRAGRLDLHAAIVDSAHRHALKGGQQVGPSGQPGASRLPNTTSSPMPTGTPGTKAAHDE